MMTYLLMSLKYWKQAAFAVLLVLLLGSAYLARERGEDLREARQQLDLREAQYKLTLRLLDEARRERRERMNFRTLQTQKFKEAHHAPLVLDPQLRSAYDGLRQRQSAAAASR